MRDDEHDPIPPDAAESLSKGFLRPFVQRGGRLVEDEKDRVAEERPREGDPLTFSAGKPCPALPQRRIVAAIARDRIFRPLGMEHSAFAAHQGQSGMHTTAGDLVKFGRHLLDVRRTRKAGILTPQGADALFRRCLKPEFNRTPAFFIKSGYVGFGQYFAEVNTMEAVGHAGATGCFLLIDPGLDAIEVVLTNRLDEKDTHFSSCDGNFARIFSILATHFGDEPIADRYHAEDPGFGLQIDRVKAAAESERVASKQAEELGL